MVGAGAALWPRTSQASAPSFSADGPLVVSSDDGEAAVRQALDVMDDGGAALDAVIDGVKIVEDDPDDIPGLFEENE